MLEKEIRAEDCFWVLDRLCSLYRIPFAALVVSKFPPPYTLATFHEAARALGFKTGFRPLPSDGWEKLPFPCIAFLKPWAQNETSHTGVPPGDHQVITFPAHPEKPPPQPEQDEAPKPASETLTPVLIFKFDDQQLLYFRTGSQAPETLSVADAPNLLEHELILVAREQAAQTASMSGLFGVRMLGGTTWRNEHWCHRS